MLTADRIVVGAGYAGLSPARRLAGDRPQDRIVLIEAGGAGENASGRNSGFAIDLPHNVGSSLEELEESQRFMRLARAAIDQLDQTVTTRTPVSRSIRLHGAALHFVFNPEYGHPRKGIRVLAATGRAR